MNWKRGLMCGLLAAVMMVTLGGCLSQALPNDQQARQGQGDSAASAAAGDAASQAGQTLEDGVSTGGSVDGSPDGQGQVLIERFARDKDGNVLLDADGQPYKETVRAGGVRTVQVAHEIENDYEASATISGTTQDASQAQTSGQEPDATQEDVGNPATDLNLTSQSALESPWLDGANDVFRDDVQGGELRSMDNSHVPLE